MRKLTKTIATLSLLAPLSAHSLGIGDIKLYSALNQKLNAEIALSLNAEENIGDINVALASPEKFEKLGIAWNYFISKTQFKTLVKPNGKAVIKMTSDLVLQEPIMDFLVQVSWPNGEVYKEFTVFVDPPLTYQNEASVPVISTNKSKKSLSQAIQASVSAPDFSSLAVEGQYGPTNRNDSLWKVAEKLNTHNDVSIEQMMMALFRANPSAFYKQNVNALMEGKTLKIPQRSEIFKLSEKQARNQFYRQMAIWEGKAVPHKRTETASEQVAEEAHDSSSKLTLVPPSEEVLDQTVPLTANSTETAGLASENQILQERLANLEKQFAIMQEMLVIKDQQLAEMQQSQTDETASAKDTLEETKASVNDVADQQANPQSAIEQDVSKQVAATDIPKADATPVKADQDSVQSASNTQQATKSISDSGVEEESGFNAYFIALGVLVALLFVWLFGRKRQAEDEINDSTIFTTASEQVSADSHENITVPVLDKKSTYDVGTVGESSFLSEFTPGDFDVFEADHAEVDPSSETDVYLAYGRYQQAEELMRHAIAEQPENDEYKLKLLEIFYTSENESEFENYAQELAESGKQSDINFWSKVSEMGSEIVPDSPLFTSGQEKANFETTDIPADDFVNTVISDSSPDEQVKTVSDESLLALNEEGTQTDNSETDFDLSPFSLGADDDDAADDEDLVEIPLVSDSDSDSDIENVDFDLSKFESTDASGTDQKEMTVEDQSLDIDTIEFDTSDIESKETKVTEPESLDIADNNDFDFDFNFDEPAVGVTDEETPARLEVSDLTDMDESETKIDLAKAYIDMGDLSAAKAIAQEVLEQGNDQQKLEAQAILKELS